MMINIKKFPIVLSPNLGCPEIVFGKVPEIPIIIAARLNQFVQPNDASFVGTFSLRPCDETHIRIDLKPKDQPIEITDWNLLSSFKKLVDTREILNSELHYNILGEGTRYFRINVEIPENVFDKENGKSKLRFRLFDLVLKDKSEEWERINYHAVQIYNDPIKELKFIHLTDLHIAKRNDEMLSEIVKQKTTELRKQIENRFVNPNKMFREFIKEANKFAKKGELDFIVITGDIVDFAFHGWEDKVNWDENNWKYFVDIVTGRGKERERENSNEGIKVAIFTSTGNHDWRLYPYDPKSYYKSFRVDKCDLKHFNYKSFDSSEYLDAKQVRVSRALKHRSWDKLNMMALGCRGVLARLGTFSARIFVSKALPRIFLAISFAGIIGPEVVRSYTSFLRLFGIQTTVSWTVGWQRYLILGAGVLVFLLRNFLQRGAIWLADWIVSKLGSLHAEATALHYYLANINPYFDYAFQVGRHNFIVMDTGSDIFTGDLDPKNRRKITKMSLSDNILGMSPDSRAFDSEKTYYNWSQIVWLEKVLSTLNGSAGRTFVFLHAPPLNLPKSFPNTDTEWLQKLFNCLGRFHQKVRPIFQFFLWFFRRSGPLQLWMGKIDPDKFCEENRPDGHKHILLKECDLRFGTTKNHLSEFLYLCLGHKEGDLPLPKKQKHRFLCRQKMRIFRFLHIKMPKWVQQPKQNNSQETPKLKMVDLVFSGHAHRNIEFRIEKTDTHEIRMYSGRYSEEEGKETDSQKLKVPILVQTAACGLAAKEDDKPSPNFRQITIDTNGYIKDFTKRKLEEPKNTQSDKKNSSLSSVGSQKK